MAVDLFDRPSPSRFDRIHGCASRLNDGRRHTAPSAHDTKNHEAHKAHKVGVEYQRFPAGGTPACGPVLAGVRDGWITSSGSKLRLLVIQPSLTPATARSAAPPALAIHRRDSQGFLCVAAQKML